MVFLVFDKREQQVAARIIFRVHFNRHRWPLIPVHRIARLRHRRYRHQTNRREFPQEFLCRKAKNLLVCRSHANNLRPSTRIVILIRFNRAESHIEKIFRTGRNPCLRVCRRTHGCATSNKNGKEISVHESHCSCRKTAVAAHLGGQTRFRLQRGKGHGYLAIGALRPENSSLMRSAASANEPCGCSEQ